MPTSLLQRRREYLTNIAASAVAATAAVGLGGCIDDVSRWNDEERESAIRVRNDSDDDEKVAFIVHDDMEDERLVETVATVEAGERHEIEFPVEEDGQEMWAMIRLDTENAETFDSIAGPSMGEVDLPDGYDESTVGIESGSMTPGGIAWFDGGINEFGEVRLGGVQF
ncbi:hypothetical protein SAMN04487967_1120 [Natronorubrum sediminis]|uniref:Uncharacterized protein n=1 Tax=Natronorubrum sediminis TaxID=640943 RepID=A0A1H6FQ82_9EURY|nr:hypothetical protein SAMN04487967_1120 [Natronorubrum sediminis]